MEADKPYDAYDAVALEVRPLEKRIEQLEEKINVIALALLPNGYIKEKRATKIMREFGEKRKIKFCCSLCGKSVVNKDLYCRNCGATLYGITVGRVNNG